jgi:hypothetical protein
MVMQLNATHASFREREKFEGTKTEGKEEED